MDYKEKYEMALERAKCLYSQHEVEWTDKDIEYIFPELKKSEDERIRKELITHCRNTRCVTEEGAERIAKWIAWLEKQGNKPQGKSALEAINEQKPNNKPKFNVGDWICNSACIVHIASIKDGMYYFDEGDGLDIAFVDNNYHLWTIKDARDGDVLSYRNGQWIFILKRIIDKDSFEYYTLWSTIHKDLTINDSAFSLLVNSIYPATREQRELLFSKIKEEGYIWDDEHKELKKIESQQVERWSEEDEDNLTDTCVAIRKFYHRNNGAQDLIDWLKSLKERMIWKPTKEQIIALRWVLNNIPYNKHKEEISGLLEQIQNI